MISIAQMKLSISKAQRFNAASKSKQQYFNQNTKEKRKNETSRKND